MISTAVRTEPTAACPAGETAPDRDALVRTNLALVHHLVREVLARVPGHVHRDELISAGMFALTTSAQAYDPTLGVSFASYARLRIRGALIDELRSMDWASRSVRSKAREIDAARTRLTNDLRTAPSTDEVARSLGMTRSEVDDIDHAASRADIVSLHTVSPESGADVIVCTSAGPETLLLRREQFGQVRDAVSELPERLRFVVEQYFFGQRKMADIAAELGVTESRVSQLRSQALLALRAAMKAADQLDPAADRPEGGPTDARRVALAARTTLARRLAATTVLAEPRRYAFASGA